MMVDDERRIITKEQFDRHRRGLVSWAQLEPAPPKEIKCQCGETYKVKFFDFCPTCGLTIHYPERKA
jgi:hypothetical protein